VANPRQIERVVRGAVFGLEIIYDVESPEQAADDFRVLREGLTLIECDYLGGHGSRGSGRVRFADLALDVAYGKINPELKAECEKILALA
jgi:CRISPR-associated protein Csm3